MYQRQTSLGFSLPDFGSIVRGIAGAVWRGTTVTIPTPVGPQTFNVSDPAQRAQLEAMLKGLKLNVATPQAPPRFDIARSIEQNVPGGWATVAIAVFAGVFLLGNVMRPRRA
jgi:hypothetical protein